MRELRAEVPASVLAEHFHSHPFGLYDPNPEFLRDRLMMLHRAKVYPFDKMQPDPTE